MPVPSPRVRRAWILAFGILATLGLAWASKAPCLDITWDGTEYAKMCYNDAQRLYTTRGFDQDVMPYVGAQGTNPDGTPRGFLEYPVLTGVFLYLVSRLSQGVHQFMVVNSLLLGLLAIATTWLLYTVLEDKQRLLFWIAAPPLILYAFHNWDLIAIFFAVLSSVAFARANWALSGAACALGASAKIYPGLFLPILGVAILRHEGGLRRGGLQFGAAAVSTFLVVNLPFIMLNPSLWWLTYEVQLGRAPNFESIWNILTVVGTQNRLPWLVDFATGPTLGLVNGSLLVATMGFLCVLVYRGRIAPTQALLAIVAAFLILNKVYSVQYTLWLVPFFVLLRLPVRKYAALVVSDTLAYVVVFTKLTLNEQDSIEFYPVIALAILARAAVQAWLFVGTLQRPGTSIPRRPPRTKVPLEPRPRNLVARGTTTPAAPESSSTPPANRRFP